jgi:hypothetical protein
MNSLIMFAFLLTVSMNVATANVRKRIQIPSVHAHSVCANSRMIQYRLMADL